MTVAEGRKGREQDKVREPAGPHLTSRFTNCSSHVITSPVTQIFTRRFTYPSQCSGPLELRGGAGRLRLCRQDPPVFAHWSRGWHVTATHPILTSPQPETTPRASLPLTHGAWHLEESIRFRPEINPDNEKNKLVRGEEKCAWGEKITVEKTG